MPFVQKTAQFNVQNSSSAGTAAITTTQNNDAVLTLSYWNSTSNAAPTWSDSKGNTPCSVDVTGVHSSSGSSFTHASVGRVKLASAGASHSWTISMPSSSYCEGNVVEWQGMDSSPLDQTATDTASAGDGDMAPTTGVTTVANEVVFAVASLNTGQTNSGVTDPPSGYTSIGVQSNDTITIDTPSDDVERSSSMPLIVLTASSILSVTSVSICSGAAPGWTVVTTTVGKSTFGN